MEMRILRCITGNTPRERIHNEDIRNIREDAIRWVRMGHEHEEIM